MCEHLHIRIFGTEPITPPTATCQDCGARVSLWEHVANTLSKVYVLLLKERR